MTINVNHRRLLAGVAATTLLVQAGALRGARPACNRDRSARIDISNDDGGSRFREGACRCPSDACRGPCYEHGLSFKIQT